MCINDNMGQGYVFRHVTGYKKEIKQLNLEQAREQARKLMHNLNHGVGRATSMRVWKTRLTATDTPDGELLDVTVERVDERELALGHVGSASPCCDAPDDEHASDCPTQHHDDAEDT